MSSTKTEDDNKFRRGQGNAFKAGSEVAFLAEDIKYKTFVHKYQMSSSTTFMYLNSIS